jgi:excisionase family DNA binding protein
MDDERLLTVKDVAERLQANPQTIRKWLREGKLRGTMPGGEKLGWRIPESELRRVLDAGKAAA